MIARLDPFAALPSPQDACRVTVVIPARDEASGITRTLEALTAQRDLDGSPLDPASYDVLVYANNCTDGTAEVARAVATRFPEHHLYVAEECLPPNVAHIGTARRAAMNAARARFAARRSEGGILAATDADTIPAPEWLAWTLREMDRGADVVTGRILIAPDEWRELPEAIRALLAAENTYHFTIAHLASLLDPQAHDPWPRHWQRSGPSFAVRLAAYDRAGGVPPVRALEDVALYDALVAAGARIRHSLKVRVTTSARAQSRAPGGFGARMKTWFAEGAVHRPLLVEDPNTTLARLLGEPLGPPEAQPPCMSAPDATAILHQLIARGVSAARATRSSVASIAG